ncbi:cytochrome p450 benzoate 4-monooxygenase [Astrocystis sublimbata]|nr:cytochrome p450 benzoate 4-monooxygenase [Astrocystis sublimbata]
MALLHPVVLVSLLPLWIICYWVVPYFTTYKHLRHLPGPFVAKFSNAWLALGARNGEKYARVHAAHQRYGKVVRVGFNHVSIATPEGLRTIYAHGNGFLKDTFYEAFIPGVPDVFTVRDRGEHARKRKLIANAFSPGAVHDFEPYMSANLERWVAQLDRIAASGAAEEEDDGYARMNMKPWCTFLAFDIIGDLAFGAPFGMVERGRDEFELKRPGQPSTFVPGSRSLGRRGQVNSTLGLVPALRPWAQYLPDPFLSQGLQSKANLYSIAAASVERRLGRTTTESEDGGSSRSHDILELLRRGKDARDAPMSQNELVAEAHAQLIAGSDTVSSTSCAVIYYILDGERRNPGTIVSRLQAELDSSSSKTSSPIASHNEVKNLKFLRLCIDEAMRLHSTSSIGLPRLVTGASGVAVAGSHFPPGTVLSVPSYTLHRDAAIWGGDVAQFRPERWLRATAAQKASFNPFSYGPRACVGQNVARMELALIVGTAFRRYEFRLLQRELVSHEGFSKSPDECWVGIRLRGVKV